VAVRIDDNEVRRIAHLARLNLTDAEVRQLGPQLSGILDYMQTLEALNTDGVEPTAHPLPVRDVFREDEPTASPRHAARAGKRPGDRRPVLQGAEGSRPGVGMNTMQKGASPFYPGQPVPVELFAGRLSQIQHVLERGVQQVKQGKPVAMFVQGEYGIGKSSLAGLLQSTAERDHGLHAIYAPLGSAETLDDVGASILNATIRSGTFDPTRAERVKGWLAKYIGQQSLFGLTLHADKLEQDGPSIATGLLPFLTTAMSNLKDVGVKGVFLVLDEINGITGNPKFSHFLKEIVDANAMAAAPVPLLLMLCGVEERRRDLIRHHQPIDRIFDVVDVELMSEEEMRSFFEKAFDQVGMSVDAGAMEILTQYAAGFPKIMHLIGDAAYWQDEDRVISNEDALRAVLLAADEVGKKYVDQQVYKALRSRDYHSILAKIAKSGPSMVFRRADIARELTSSESKKLDNFLRKMTTLNVIRKGDVRGEYSFIVRMVGIYIWLESLRKQEKDT